MAVLRDLFAGAMCGARTCAATPAPRVGDHESAQADALIECSGNPAAVRTKAKVHP